MPSQTKSIPQDFHSVTPYLTLSDAARALDFYKRAFGAKELSRMAGPDGKIGHAEIKIETPGSCSPTRCQAAAAYLLSH
jgi:PhnB protein